MEENMEQSEYGMNERIKTLRKESVDTQPVIDMERSRMETETYKQYEGSLSIPELRAQVLYDYFSKKTLHIGDQELIVGEKGKSPQSSPTFPELCCHTIQDMHVMNDRALINFSVTQEDLTYQEQVVIPYWEKRSIRSRILTSMTDQWKSCYESGIFTEFMEQRGPGHTAGANKFYEKGFQKIKEEVIHELNTLDYFNDCEAFEKANELRAMRKACDAIMVLGERYAQYAEELAKLEKDPKRKEELMEIAHNCSVVPKHKPQTFWQAIQMYWFVHLSVTTELNPWDAYSPGRLDQHLNPFYEHDTETGTLNRNQALELLECLWIKFNNQPAPPKVGITLKESSTYTDFANINTGGIDKNGKNGVNEVSYLILDCMDDMKLLQPSSNVQISSKTPMKFIKRACEISRKGWGQPAFYNTEAIIAELMNQGKSIADARCGGSSGCVETGAWGNESYILTGYFNIPKILELTLNNGVDPQTGKQLGLALGMAQEFKEYQQLWDAFSQQMKYFLDIKIAGNNVIEKIYAKYMPAPFLSLIVNDCISKGKDYNNGGARYNTRYIQGTGIATITDSLASIKYNVYDNQYFSMDDLMKALQNDFEGHELVWNRVRNHTPKYGNDDDYADNIMQDVFNLYHDLIAKRPTMSGGSYQIDMLPTTCHVYFGSVMGASANGRKAHLPISEGISPEKGADVHGPTAVLQSCAKMDHLITGGTLLNQKFAPEVVAGELGLDQMANLVRTYFNMNGHHIQFNVVDKKILLEAQKHPDEYKDLIVRVAGYSDHFRNLSRQLQDEIIHRTEQRAL